ncbi:hypothetical protein CsSME_00006875 [Camellia sinensis var. sinensis]
MSQKRQQEDSKGRSEGNGSDEKRRKHPSFRRMCDFYSTDEVAVDECHHRGTGGDELAQSPALHGASSGTLDS